VHISEEQRFSEAEFKRLTSAQRDHYATLSGQGRIDYVQAFRDGRLGTDARQSVSLMRDVGRFGTVVSAALLMIGVVGIALSQEPSSLMWALLWLSAGALSVSSFAWMMGALETRLIALTMVMRART
jgi:hypothetical protein